MNINNYYLLFSLILISFILLIALYYLNKNSSIKIVNRDFYKYSNNCIFFENLKRINKNFLVIKMKKTIYSNEEYYIVEEEFLIKNKHYNIKIKIYNNL